MGISLRIFIVNDDDTLQRLPLARYDRLLERNPKESMPQYAGKRVRKPLWSWTCYTENRWKSSGLNIRFCLSTRRAESIQPNAKKKRGWPM